MRIKTKSCDSTNHLIGSSAQKSQNGGERDAWRFTRTRLLRFFIFFFFKIPNLDGNGASDESSCSLTG